MNSPFPAVFAKLLAHKNGVEHRAAIARAPMVPLLCPPEWRGVPSGVCGRRLFDAPSSPWLALYGVSSEDPEMPALTLARIKEVVNETITKSEAITLAVGLMHDRMVVDPTAAMWSERDMMFIAWDDLAASLVLHSEVMKTVHAQLGDQLVVAMPTRATLILGVRGRHEDRISRIGRDMIARVGVAHQLSDAMFAMERGAVFDRLQEL